MRAAFLAAIALLTLAGASHVAAATWSQETIVFTYEQDVPGAEDRTQMDVYLARPGSSKRQRLAWGPADEVEPALSPDRKLLAFVRVKGANPGLEEPGIPYLRVKRLADGKLFRLGRGRSPSWSPDGRRLAIVTARGIETIRPDGRDRRLVVRGHVWSVSWSGGVLVYVRGPDNVLPDIWVARPDGTEQRDLGLNGTEPTLSPDGTLVAYTDFFNLWVASVDGTGARQLGEHDPERDINVDSHPSWSPDGSRIAFASGVSLLDFETTGVHGDGVEPESNLILVVPASGGTSVELVRPSSGADSEPSWR